MERDWKRCWKLLWWSQECNLKETQDAPHSIFFFGFCSAIEKEGSKGFHVLSVTGHCYPHYHNQPRIQVEPQHLLSKQLWGTPYTLQTPVFHLRNNNDLFNNNICNMPGIEILQNIILMCMPAYSVVSNSLWSHRLQSTRLLCPWNSPGKNTRCIAIFFSRRSSRPRDRNQVTCICRQVLYHLSH